MESNEQNKLTDKIETGSDTEKRLTAVRREKGGSLGEKSEGIKKKKPSQTSVW